MLGEVFDYKSAEELAAATGCLNSDKLMSSLA